LKGVVGSPIGRAWYHICTLFMDINIGKSDLPPKKKKEQLIQKYIINTLAKSSHTTHSGTKSQLFI
jgi:hypothetical protein